MSKVSITRSLLDDLAMSISTKSGEAVPMTLTEMKDAVDSIQTGGTLITKSITENGTYNAEDDSADGYSSVTVNVPSPTLQSKSKSYTPTETAQSETVTADSGYDGLSSVAVSVGAISSTYVGSGITRRSSSDLTASGATVTVPSGYYSAQASKAVASGTAGTPTATKGSVSNHSVSVTPSVTNTAGYISGGTINGTAVTVTASELVSGSDTVTENDTYDVTNLAELIVDVPSGSGSKRSKAGTVAGDGTVTLQIPCNFEPDEIYVYGDLSGDVSLRGIVSVTILKDDVIYVTSDTSQSADAENASFIAHGITGYNESESSEPHATYSNNVLTIDMVTNTSSNRFASGVSYSYALVSYGEVSGVTITDEPNSTGVTCVITSGGSPTPAETWELIWEGIAQVNSDTPYNYFWIAAMSDIYFYYGEVWRITINGMPYRTTAIMHDNTAMIGNAIYSGGEDDGSGCPSDFFNAGWGAVAGDTELPVGNHALKFERLVMS